MSNIRVDVDYALRDGLEMKFRSPVDCSQITGLIVYYPGEDGNITSKVFSLADAHGNNVGDIDHLFAEDVVVKVILDVTTSMAFVQNADTNAYLEAQLASKAPAGYGLGTELTPINHINNADKNGFYFVSGSVASGHPFDYGAANILVVGGSADLMPTQIGFGISMNPVTNNAMAIRASDGIWEWINPPMKQEQEYRTTERLWGYPVYKKLFYYGALPNGQSNANHGITDLMQVKKVTLIPQGLRTYLDHNPIVTKIDVDAEKVYITTNSNELAGNACFVLIEYVKS